MSTPDRDSRRDSLKSRMLKEKLEEVKQLVSLSSSLRLRVNKRSSAPRTLKERPSVIGVFGQEARQEEEVAPVKQRDDAETIQFLREDNRRLTEDFEEALNVIRRISDAREADAVLRQPVDDILLKQLEKERAENVRLRVKINELLSELVQVAHMGENSDDEAQELRDKINEGTITLYFSF
jgi:hypothetical protein